jgi:hypothetical protein
MLLCLVQFFRIVQPVLIGTNHRNMNYSHRQGDLIKNSACPEKIITLVLMAISNYRYGGKKVSSFARLYDFIPSCMVKKAVNEMKSLSDF